MSKKSILPSPAGISSSTTNSAAVARWWHDRDVLAMPYTNFWILVFEYQIDKEKTDSQLADDLDIDRTTVSPWRSSLESPHAIEHLIARVNNLLPPPPQTQNTDISSEKSIDSTTTDRHESQIRRRIKLDLELCLAKIDRSIIPNRRLDAKLPKKKVLDALDCSIKTVLEHAIKSRSRKITAENLAYRFKTAIVDGHYGDPEISEKKLCELVGSVAKTSALMALLRARSLYPLKGGLDEGFQERFKKLRAELKDYVIKAENAAWAHYLALSNYSLHNDKYWEFIALDDEILYINLGSKNNLQSVHKLGNNDWMNEPIARINRLIKHLASISKI